MTTPYTLNASGPAYQNTVGYEHFGTNYLFTKEDDPANPDLDYNGIRADLNEGNGTSIRYPGGTMTEKFLNPADITGHFSSGLINSAGGELVSTLSFLEQAANEGWSVTFVLPTKRYLDVDPQTVQDEIKAYVSKILTEAARLGVTVDGFELGNEWYMYTKGLNVLTATEYGEIAGNLALATKAGIAAANGILLSDSDPNTNPQPVAPYIAIQTTKEHVTFSHGTSGTGDRAGDIDENNDETIERVWKDHYKDLIAIHNALDSVTDAEGNIAADAIDAVVGHAYVQTKPHSEPGATDSFNDYATWDPDFKDQGVFEQMEYWEYLLGTDLTKVVSEWNTHIYRDGPEGARDEPEQDEFWGIRQVDPILTLFGVMVAEGVDQANFWTVQSNIWNDMILPTGEGISQAGGASRRAASQDILDLMSDNLIRTHVLDMNGKVSSLGNYDRTDNDRNNKYSGLADWVGDTEVRVHGYQSSEKSVFYFSSRSDGVEDIDISLGGFGDSSSRIEVTHMWVKGHDLENISAEAAKSHTTYITTETYTYTEFQALSELTFKPYETISIEVIYNPSNVAGETEIGHDGEDLQFGTSGNDTLSGLGGTDRLYGRSGNDELYGGDGRDYLEGGDGNDTITGGDGADKAYGSWGDDSLVGGDGNDSLYGGDGNDRVFGDEGHDLLDGWSGDDYISGGVGSDTITGGNGHDGLSGGEDNDVIYGNAGHDTLWGSYGEDLLIGGAGRDHLAGGLGVDTASYFGGSAVTANLLNHTENTGNASGDTYNSIENLKGSAFADHLTGDNASNMLWGEEGNDTVIAGDGADTVYGSWGDDSLVGGNGNDSLFGGADDDRVFGNEGNDSLDGWSGDDYISGGYGNDTITGGDGADKAYGSWGDDSLVGGDGNDSLYGGAGNDRVFGSEGHDSLDGWSGDDYLNGGIGDDVLSGGAGSDTFVFTSGDGTDTITDFDITEDTLIVMGQTIDLAGDPNDLPTGFTLTDIGDDLTLTYGGGDEIVLNGLGI